MENIFKVKVRTNSDPRWSYPSERKYSASIVLGLGVVHLAFATASLLMSCLTITSKSDVNERIPAFILGEYNENEEMHYSDEMDLDALLTAGPCLTCIGAVAAGCTALLAWKRWYIDHNIKLFFAMSLLSIVTSTICIILESLLLVYLNNYCYSKELINKTFNLKSKDLLIINILITAVLECIWSFISIKVSFEGMKKNYPEQNEERENNQEKKVNVSTIYKGNSKNMDIQKDVINQVNKTLGTLQGKTNSNLPKDESHSEYCERVNKFLSNDVHSASV